TIGVVDHVQDQITLQFFGGGKAKVLFDGRTKIQRDGKPSLLRELKAGDRVYVETVLDGTAVFARSIRVVSRTGQGQSSGQVIGFHPETGELVVRDALSPEPLTLRVTSSSQVERSGQPVPASTLRAGALVSVEFVPSAASKGDAVADRISILAEP